MRGASVINSIILKNERDAADARKLADHLHVPLREASWMQEPDSLNLVYDEEGLALCRNGQMLRGDFSGMSRRLRTGNLQREFLVKTVKIKGVASPVVLDAAAGMGEDSLILAAAGCRVQLYERDPVIAALLKDAVRRASAIPELSDAVQRMTVCEEDSIFAMKTLKNPPDVIYLDPMFPEKRKSALVKKKFQLLHYLEQPCEEEELLLQTALDMHVRKIVIKRPLKGSFLAGVKPHYSLKGKAIRYDCFVFTQNRETEDVFSSDL